MKKIIIAGGGTGGHIFPALAIANEFKRRDPSVEILFVGANGKMEMEKIPQAGYKIIGIDIAGFNRSSLLKNLTLPFKLVNSFMQVKKIFKSFQPDIAIGVGGYSTFPVLKYAQKLGVPTFIHESNSFAGKSNMMLGKDATRIFVAWENMDRFFPKDKIIVSGNPVRKNIVSSSITKEEALRSFGLEEGKRTILVVGGSLGARSINNAMETHMLDINTLNIQLIWQTGKVNSERYISKGRAFSNNVWVGEFIQDMDKAYAAADIVISRAGAMSVSELCVAGKPVVFVPYPFAAEDHQSVNAEYLVKKDAAILVKDEDAQMHLFSTATDLLFDDSKRAAFSQNISKLAVTNASEVIVDDILKIKA